MNAYLNQLLIHQQIILEWLLSSTIHKLIRIKQLVFQLQSTITTTNNAQIQYTLTIMEAFTLFMLVHNLFTNCIKKTVITVAIIRTQK